MNPRFLLPVVFLISCITSTSAFSAAATRSHKVAAKETLYGIARKYDGTIAQIKKANGLTSDLIKIGQMLKIPVVDHAGLRPPVEAGGTEADSPNKESFSGLSEADRWKLQIFLDSAQFAPGKVDGLPGEFTGKAVERWIAAAPDRSWNSLLAAARKQVAETHVLHTIPAVADRYVGSVPASLEGKAAATSLSYESLAEFVTERFHTDLSTLERLNPGLDLAALKSGDRLKVPAVQPFTLESWSVGTAKTRLPGASVRIHHAARMIEVFKADGTLAAAFPITVGAKADHIRTGTWYVHSWAANPTFLWDDLMLKEGRKGSQQHLLPPGPNNPVGILWLEIEPLKGPRAHIGIHGTNDPARIGRNHSSGCIRLANWDIVRFSRLVGPGTTITWETSAPAAMLAARL